jgi:hypothetical protein
LKPYWFWKMSALAWINESLKWKLCNLGERGHVKTTKLENKLGWCFELIWRVFFWIQIREQKGVAWIRDWVFFGNFLTYLDSQKRKSVSECESDFTWLLHAANNFYFLFWFFLMNLGFAFVVHTNRPIWVEPCLLIGQFELLPKRSQILGIYCHQQSNVEGLRD